MPRGVRVRAEAAGDAKSCTAPALKGHVEWTAGDRQGQQPEGQIGQSMWTAERPAFSRWREPRWAYSPTRVRVTVGCNGMLGGALFGPEGAPGRLDGLLRRGYD